MRLPKNINSYAVPSLAPGFQHLKYNLRNAWCETKQNKKQIPKTLNAAQNSTMA
jgi:hypothetical protein